MMYDAVIVGASIAGLYTGMKLARGGWTVALADRKKKIGLPVRCGEATGSREELSRFFTVSDDMISCDLTGITLHCAGAPAITFDMPGRAVMLRRDRLEESLAHQAQTAGATILLNTPVAGLLQDSLGAVRGVRTQAGNEILARFIVGADGCESKVGQWAGITTSLGLLDAFSSVQYRLKTGAYNDNRLHFFTGLRHIPSGYIWVFPKSGGWVLAGAGVYGCGSAIDRASVFLNDFIGKFLPDAARGECITGCVPLSVCPKKLHRNNVAIVGDAARQANPLTAGGIMNTFEAADCLVRALTLGRTSNRIASGLGRYERKWRRQRFNQRVFFYVKELFLHIPEKQLSSIAAKTQRMSRKEIRANRPFTFSLALLFKLIVVIAPALFALARKRPQR